MIGLKKNVEVIEDNGDITASSFSLESLMTSQTEFYLQIPLYQRLYVWDAEEIELFIEDISEAFMQGLRYYNIGNMMLSVSHADSKTLVDLIDGQQRFTTIWLISIILGKYCNNLKKFAFENGRPRLSYISRDTVNEYFHNLAEIEIDILSNENVSLKTGEESLEPINRAIANIYNLAKGIIALKEWDKQTISRFGDYIHSNLLMVQTTVPADNNLNQIFESLNSGGKQLENHQILKARFLEVLKNGSIPAIKIRELIYKWDGCTNMNQYLERNIYSLQHVRWEDVFHHRVWTRQFESNKPDDYFLLRNYAVGTVNAIDLISILEHEPEVDFENSIPTGQDSRSIISFSQLLLHALRVQNLIKGIQHPVPVDSQNLLRFFGTKVGRFSEASNVVEFIDLLFELRFLFDKYVIRWSLDGEDTLESLIISKAYFNASGGSYSVRRESVESNRLLSHAQSVLYIVQESKTQYWLTSYLYFLRNRYLEQHIEESYTDAIKSATAFVENLDNYFYSQKNQDENMSIASFKDFANIFKQKQSGNLEFVAKQLGNLQGTFFFRYWFYKTEYLLWKYRHDFKPHISEMEFNLWSRYKMSFKTSIEHIFPQSKDGFESDADRDLYSHVANPILKDFFGNLVLLTVTENSEYGSLDVNEKKIKYKLKLNNNSIDSLKSSLIFNLVGTESKPFFWEEGVWNFSKAKYHFDHQILPLYKKHLER